MHLNLPTFFPAEPSLGCKNQDSFRSQRACIIHFWFRRVGGLFTFHSEPAAHTRSHTRPLLCRLATIPLASGESKQKGRTPATPWLRMLTQPAVWAIIINNFAFHYAFYVVMNWLPTYFDKVCTTHTTGVSALHLCRVTVQQAFVLITVALPAHKL